MQNAVEEIIDQEHVASHVHGPDCNHEHEHDAETVHNIHGRIVMNRNEKKARKELLKLGLKPIEGIHRVTFKRGKMIFAINEPEVYKNPTSDSYIVFGEARVEDPGFQAQLAAAQRMAQRAAEEAAQKEAQAGTEETDAAAAEGEAAAAGDEEEVDASGLNESDIKIVMEQANVSRAKAIKALREHDNDVVNTIMELSM